MPSPIAILFPSSSDKTIRLRKEQLRVEYSRRYARKQDPHLDAVIEAFTIDIARQSGSMAYNGPAYRLSGFHWDKDSLILDLGPVQYFEYLALLRNKQIRQKLADPDFRDSESLPNVLGTSGLVITSDNKILCVQRSMAVSSYQGFLDLPGGHPEPDIVEQHDPDGKPSPEQYNALVAEEVFDSIVREIEEETGLDRTHLDAPQLLAIISNSDDLHKPDVVFLLHADVTAREIETGFENLDPSPDEIERLDFLDPRSWRNNRTTLKRTPAMEGVLEFYFSTIR